MLVAAFLIFTAAVAPQVEGTRSAGVQPRVPNDEIAMRKISSPFAHQYLVQHAPCNGDMTGERSTSPMRAPEESIHP